MSASPVRYTPAIETIDEDEEQTRRQLTETLLRISETTYADSGHAFRSVHAKSHGIVEGELEVLPGLPPNWLKGCSRSLRNLP